MQGVGFRPFVYRLAHRFALAGWVRNAATGVVIHVEGAGEALHGFVSALSHEAPPAAVLAQVAVSEAVPRDFARFEIRHSQQQDRPTVRISPDLCVCPACLNELQDPADPRYGYPYINCTNCGPRYSIITALPYDRPRTTMRTWALCPACDAAYHDPQNRRFHAQPTACPACGPQYVLSDGATTSARGDEALAEAARLLREGRILAVKGLGGYHLACDAENADAVQALRQRKFRKEKPFALMVPDVETARTLVAVGEEEEQLLTCVARPLVLMTRRDDPDAVRLPEAVAPDNQELGLMLPYTPLHVLLFAHAAPRLLVMTSANRSSEPIAYRDEEAVARLGGLADAFLIGERPIARRVDDSVARVGPLGTVLLRRARGYAPGAVTSFPVTPAARPVLAVGADLKNTVTLVVHGEAFVSQHLGDLTHYDVQKALRKTIRDLTAMYEVPLHDALIVHDAHPQYCSTALAIDLRGERLAVQHHCAHIASVLAERQAWDQAVVGVAFDGTGYGDDGSIWGGEVFVGSLREGFDRVAHLLPAQLPGGDAAARVPVQAAAGFLAALADVPDLAAAPFHFPLRFQMAAQLVEKNLRTFATTSVGRLFDAVAALVGFTRPTTFEGQAALWLEHLARTAPAVAPYPFPDLDYRPLLRAVIADRLGGRPAAEIARAVHAGVARSVAELGSRLARAHGTDTLVVSGGVFQNVLLLQELHAALRRAPTALRLWTNRRVPPNDGGISLGQAALAVLSA